MKIEHYSGRPESPIMAIKVNCRDSLILANRFVLANNNAFTFSFMSWNGKFGLIF